MVVLFQLFELHSFNGRGGGLVVSVPAFYSDNPSSNPTGYLNFLYEKAKINEKDARVDLLLKKSVQPI